MAIHPALAASMTGSKPVTNIREAPGYTPIDYSSGSSKIDYSTGRTTRVGSRGGSGSGSSGSGGPAQTQPTYYTSNLLQKSFTSQAALQQAENVYKQEQAKQKLIEFSKKGGIQTSQQAKDLFKTSIRDIKTDSQAISKATVMADDILICLVLKQEEH